MRIKSFMPLRPPEKLAHLVAGPPYDTVSREEAKTIARGNPMSFLRVVRSEIDLPDTAGPGGDEVFARARSNLREFIINGWLIRESEPCVYVYRQTMDSHSQTGIVACCHVDDYRSGAIKRHEFPREAVMKQRARHVRELSANTGPVMLTYRDNAGIDRLVSGLAAGRPLYDFADPDEVRHTVWRVESGTDLLAELRNLPAAYIADGHHRAAAAEYVASELDKVDGADRPGEAEHNWFLCVLFPAAGLSILPYNRVVADLNALSEQQFLARLNEYGRLNETVNPNPERRGRVCAYLGGKWHAFDLARGSGAAAAALDADLLQKDVLGPILGIDDPVRNDRIAFVGGKDSVGKIRREVDSGSYAVAFSMCPVTVDQVMDAADRGSVLPPKSTWFEPKSRSGLFVHDWQ